VRTFAENPSFYTW